MAKSKVSIEKQKIRKAKATKAKATKSKLDKECYEKCVKEKGKFKCKPTNKNCPPQKQLPLVNRYNGQTPLISLPSRQQTFTEPQKNRYSNFQPQAQPVRVRQPVRQPVIVSQPARQPIAINRQQAIARANPNIIQPMYRPLELRGPIRQPIQIRPPPIPIRPQPIIRPTPFLPDMPIRRPVPEIPRRPQPRQPQPTRPLSPQRELETPPMSEISETESVKSTNIPPRYTVSIPPPLYYRKKAAIAEGRPSELESNPLFAKQKAGLQFRETDIQFEKPKKNIPESSLIPPSSLRPPPSVALSKKSSVGGSSEEEKASEKSETMEEQLARGLTELDILQNRLDQQTYERSGIEPPSVPSSTESDKSSSSKDTIPLSSGGAGAIKFPVRRRQYSGETPEGSLSSVSTDSSGLVNKIFVNKEIEALRPPSPPSIGNEPKKFIFYATVSKPIEAQRPPPLTPSQYSSGTPSTESDPVGYMIREQEEITNKTRDPNSERLLLENLNLLESTQGAGGGAGAIVDDMESFRMRDFNVPQPSEGSSVGLESMLNTTSDDI